MKVKAKQTSVKFAPEGRESQQDYEPTIAFII